ncbi:MAG: signal peptidase I [Oscillospiraceae bacterium]|nr:signal peptidase I [Oscillospiraceae bacterium]
MPEEKETEKGALSVILNFFSTFITTVIVLVAVVFVAIRFMGWSLYSVDSYSMTPTYPIDSLVIVQPVDPEEIQVGDVITFVIDQEGTMVTHRVTSISSLNRTFTTKGDANDEEDASPVLWDNVVGRVFLGIPVLGGLLRLLTAEENRTAVIAVIAGLLFISIAWDVISQCRKKRKEEKQPRPAGRHLPPEETKPQKERRSRK